MSEDSLPVPSDPLLIPYLEATEEREADRLLEELLRRYAEPVINRVLGRDPRRRTFNAGARQSREAEDREDIYAETVSTVTARLCRQRQSLNTSPIANFAAYVSAVAANTRSSYLRKRYPQRASLRNRICYLLNHTSGLSRWERDGQWLCGFSLWRDRNLPVENSRRLRLLRENPRTFRQDALPGTSLVHMPPADLAAALFQWVGHPLPLEDLVTAMAHLLEVRDRTPDKQPASPEEGDPPEERIPDPQPGVHSLVYHRQFLRWLWTEVRTLPPRQCAALLLNLRDGKQNGILFLLSELEIADQAQIAAAMAMSGETLQAIWDELPLDDLTIAGILSVERQQVINLRKSARDRLARRLRDFENGK
jgi:hypothetical protein